ncbi:MAG: response regulator, partial [Lentisphaerae bacterium]
MTATTNHTSPINILFVDDSSEMLHAIHRQLRKTPWTLHFATSGTEALDILQKKTIHILVSDVRMPNFDGFRLLEEVHLRFPHIRVMLMTGLPTLDAAVEAIKLGAVHYLAKPLDFDKLRTKIEQTIDEIRNASQHQQTAGTFPLAIAGFRILNKIAEGAMGIIFLALRQQDDRKVAIKILKINQLAADEVEEARIRFEREAAVAQKIDHPNVVKLYSYGLCKDEHIPFIVMEYVEGTPLNLHIAQKRYVNDIPAVINILRALLSALSEIHKHILCHRDIKPANILICPDGSPKLIDFGIAKLPTSRLTNHDCIMGTPAYIAPECVLDTPHIDARSDLFSLGIVAYEMLTGTRPFSGDNLVSLAR